jgi:hypothetical protein
MRGRLGFTWIVVLAGIAGLVSGSLSGIKAAGPGVVHVAELADVSLGSFYNRLFRYSADHIVDDHGVRLGSFGSDIFQDTSESYNEFWAVTDRGPNGNPGRRTFLAPKFDPLILHGRVTGSNLVILDAMPILDAAGLPVTGLSNVNGFDETPYDFNGTNVLEFNPNGLDTEGLVRTRDGSFWLVDEYSPSLVHVDRRGRVIERWVPVDSRLATTLATTPNYIIKKTLPRILNFRRQNRGFEGIAITPDEKTLFIAMQSPLDYPTTTLGRASRSVRILRFDIASERITGEFVYFFDEVCAFLREPANCTVAPGEMKVSGLAAFSANAFLVLERTDTAAKVYRVDASRATNILDSAWDSVASAPGASTPALESLPNPATQGVVVLPKSLVIDLSLLPDMPNKIEGISLIRDRPDLLAIANDNDFGLVDNATFDAGGRLSNDTWVKSKLIYVELAAPVN